MAFAASNWFVLTVLTIFFLLHLPAINSAPLDEHAWRQVDTAAVARNFKEESPNIFYPRVDMRMQYSGITGMEFPVYNYLIFITNSVFGFAHWHGRIITLLASLFGLYFFYKLLQSRFSERVARLGVVTLASTPIYFYFARNIQPDMLMLATSIAALFYTERFTVTAKQRDLWIAMVFLSLAMLIKIPAVFIELPMMALLGWKRLLQALTQQNLLFGVVVILAPNLAWYVWSAHLSSIYGLGSYYYGDLNLHLSQQLATSQRFWSGLVSYWFPLKQRATLVALIFFAAGIGWCISKKRWFALVWTAAILLFLVIFANKSYFHNYYSLPIMPPLALVLSLGLVDLFDRLGKKPVIGFILGLFYLGGLSLIAAPKLKASYQLTNPEFSRLEKISDEFSHRSDLFVTVGVNDPRMLYFAHRKGWSLLPEQVSSADLDRLKMLGAKYVVVDTSIDNRNDKEPWDSLAQVYFDGTFTAFRL